MSIKTFQVKTKKASINEALYFKTDRFLLNSISHHQLISCR